MPTFTVDHNGRTFGKKTGRLYTFERDVPFEGESGDLDHLGKYVKKKAEKKKAKKKKDD